MRIPTLSELKNARPGKGWREYKSDNIFVYFQKEEPIARAQSITISQSRTAAPNVELFSRRPTEWIPGRQTIEGSLVLPSFEDIDVLGELREGISIHIFIQYNDPEVIQGIYIPNCLVSSMQAGSFMSFIGNTIQHITLKEFITLSQRILRALKCPDL